MGKTHFVLYRKKSDDLDVPIIIIAIATLCLLFHMCTSISRRQYVVVARVY